MFCNKCGSQLPDDSKFCNKCGASQDSARPASSESDIVASIRAKIIAEREQKKNQKKKFPFLSIFFLIVIVLAAFGIYWGMEEISFDSSDTSIPKNKTKKTMVNLEDEDALADKNCKNELGFSNIYACRRALSSAGIDADKYVREKWITTGNRIKGIGFCEGFTRSKHSDQYKVHYDKSCNAKELYIWSDKLGDFQRIK